MHDEPVEGGIPASVLIAEARRRGMHRSADRGEVGRFLALADSFADAEIALAISVLQAILADRREKDPEP